MASSPRTDADLLREAQEVLDKLHKLPKVMERLESTRAGAGGGSKAKSSGDAARVASELAALKRQLAADDGGRGAGNGAAGARPATAPAPAQDHYVPMTAAEAQRFKMERQASLDALSTFHRRLREKADSRSLQAVFREFDLDGNGTVSYDEFKRAMRSLNMPLTDQTVTKLAKLADVDNDGEIDYNEFQNRLLRNKLVISDDDLHRVLSADDGGLVPGFATAAGAAGDSAAAPSGASARGSRRSGKSGSRRRGSVGSAEEANAAAARAGMSDVDEARLRRESSVQADNIATFRRRLREKADNRSLKAVFKTFDFDGNGTVSYDEFRRAMRDLNMPLTDKAVHKLAKLADVDGDGEVDYGEFERRFLSNTSVSDDELRRLLADEVVVAKDDEKETFRGFKYRYTPRESSVAELMGMSSPDKKSPRRRRRKVDPTASPEERERERQRREEARSERAHKLLSSKLRGNTERLRAAMRNLDRERKGEVTPSSFRQTMDRLGVDLSERQIASLMAQYGRKHVDRFGKQHSTVDYNRLSDKLDSLTGHGGARRARTVLRQVRDKVYLKSSNMARTFVDFDEDHDGTVSYDELRKGLYNLGCELSEGDFDTLVKAVDDDGNGQIDYVEFSNALEAANFDDTGSATGGGGDDDKPRARSSANAFTPEVKKARLIRQKIVDKLNQKGHNFRDVFSKFDTDRSGTLSHAEIHAGLYEMGFFLGEQDLARVLNTVDPKHKGEVTYKEFCEGMQIDPVEDVGGGGRLQQGGRKLFDRRMHEAHNEDGGIFAAPADGRDAMASPTFKTTLHHSTAGVQPERRPRKAAMSDADREGSAGVSSTNRAMDRLRAMSPAPRALAKYGEQNRRQTKLWESDEATALAASLPSAAAHGAQARTAASRDRVGLGGGGYGRGTEGGSAVGAKVVHLAAPPPPPPSATGVPLTLEERGRGRAHAANARFATTNSSGVRDAWAAAPSYRDESIHVKRGAKGGRFTKANVDSGAMQAALFGTGTQSRVSHGPAMPRRASVRAPDRTTLGPGFTLG